MSSQCSPSPSSPLKTYLALAVGASAATGTTANAAVIPWDGTPITVKPTDASKYIVWDINTMSATATNSVSGLPSTSFFIAYGNPSIVYTTDVDMGLNVTQNGEWDTSLTKLDFGDSIGASSLWNNGTRPVFMNFLYWTPSPSFPWRTGANDTQGYIGFRDKVGSDYFYGWAEFTYDNGGGQSLTLENFAWENSANAPITAGAIPEPSSLALLAAGAAGLALLRRRNKNA